MGEALYRKYRSTKLDEVIGQDHIVTTVKSMVAKGKVPHAFLLTGPRGVGKTSVARLLACMVNKVKYEDLESQVDIIEIDAASNRKIDEIREIREQVNIVPSSLKYKVYIIDEVHMLTREAFNALLKTLEEPPEHVIFILATTEFHKLPPTIISRCVRFHFKPISADEISRHLRTISNSEGIGIDDDALETLASHSEGSFRDGITLLENFRTFDTKVTKSDVEHNLGVASKPVVDNIIEAIKAGDAKEIFSIVDSLQYNGINYSLLAKDLSNILRNSLIQNKNIIARDKTIELLEGLIEVQSAPQPKQKLVIVLLGSIIDRGVQSPEPQTPKKKDESLKEPERINKPEKPKKDHVEPKPENIEQIEPKTPPKPPKSAQKGESIDEQWAQTLEILKEKQNTVYAISRMGKISAYNDGQLTVEFKFPFHAKRLNDSKNKILIEKYLSESAGETIKIQFSVAGQQPPDENIQNISNIFGPPEVLE